MGVVDKVVVVMEMADLVVIDKEVVVLEVVDVVVELRVELVEED